LQQTLREGGAWLEVPGDIQPANPRTTTDD
jgi:hypothetical protein